MGLTSRKMQEEGGVKSLPHNPLWDISFEGDSGLTKQEFVKDCDVNVILARCLKVGAPVRGADIQAVFADVSEVGDFSDCVRRVKAAEDAFMSLPAEVRGRFKNDPGQLMAFIMEDANYDEALKLGLVEKKPAPVVPAEVPFSPAPGVKA